MENYIYMKVEVGGRWRSGRKGMFPSKVNSHFKYIRKPSKKYSDHCFN